MALGLGCGDAFWVWFRYLGAVVVGPIWWGVSGERVGTGRSLCMFPLSRSLARSRFLML
jgi:hypothetical protein